MQFNEKIVLVTGASRNTGKAIAARFAAEGATVFVNGSHAENVRRTVAKLREQGLERLIEAPADVGDPAAVESLFARIRERADRLDILVNNAVSLGVGPSFEETPMELFEKVIRVNLIGLFQVAREAARMMIAQGGGVVVNIGSTASTRALRNRCAYVASKGGIDALTRAMAVDLGPRGIRVNTVTPGYIYTDRWDALLEEVLNRRRANIPLGKEASGDDIASAVLFLASDGAAGIHGARLVVDGGCSAQYMPANADI